MIYLVTGGSGSGKSAYAEELVQQAGRAKRFYVATMEVFGEEGKKKVERHRKLRQGKGFLTVECPKELDNLALEEAEERVVLLECMANLAANELFSAQEEGSEERAEAAAEEGSARKAEETTEERKKAEEALQDRIWAAGERMKKGIRHLEAQCRLLVVVSSEVFSDGIDYEEETKAYIRLLEEINCWLGKRAEKVVEVVYGIPVVLKGGGLAKE